LGPSLLNSRRPNIDNWLEYFYSIYDKSHSEKLTVWLIMALYNVCHHYINEGNFELLDRSLQYFDILYKKYRNKDYEIFQGLIIGGIRHSDLKKLEKYLDKMKLLYLKYPLELNLEYAKLLFGTYKCHAYYDIVPRPKLLYGYIKKLQLLYEKHANNKIAKILIAAFVLSIRLFSKHKMCDYVIDDVKALKRLFEKHQNATTRMYYFAAVGFVNQYCKNSNIQVLDQEVQNLLKFQYNQAAHNLMHAVVGDNVEEKWSAEYRTSLTEYEIHRIDWKSEDVIQKLKNTLSEDESHEKIERYSAFPLFVVSDKELPNSSPGDEVAVQDFSMSAHTLLSITHKAANSDENRIRLLLCPLRLSHDQPLRETIGVIHRQTVDSLTDLGIYNALIGLTSKRGLSILQNRLLTTSQKDHLMVSEKCTILYLIFGFPSLPITLKTSFQSAQQLKSWRLKDCPYCTKLDWT